MSCNGNCNRCNNFVRSTALTLTDGILFITLPTQTYYNNEVYCVAIAQNIPVGATSSTPVSITINGVNYTILTTQGHYLYADQLMARNVFRFKIAADSNIFMVNACRLKNSNTFLPEVLNTTPATN